MKKPARRHRGTEGTPYERGGDFGLDIDNGRSSVESLREKCLKEGRKDGTTGD